MSSDSAPPPVLQPTGVHHVAVIASDYARSRRFYTQVLGLQVVHEHYRAERQSYKLDLQLPDGTQVELFSFPHPPRAPVVPRGLRPAPSGTARGRHGGQRGCIGRARCGGRAGAHRPFYWRTVDLLCRP